MKIREKIYNWLRAYSDSKPPIKKQVSWQQIADKYKDLPNFRIEHFANKTELWLYQKGGNIKKYQFPLKCNDIVFISKHFPADHKFFERMLIQSFKLVRKYER